MGERGPRSHEKSYTGPETSSLLHWARDAGHCHWQRARGVSLECRDNAMHFITLLPYGIDMGPANHILSWQALQLQCLVSLSLRMTPIFSDVPASQLSDSVSPALCALTYPVTSAALHKEGLLSPRLLSILPSLLAGISLTWDCDLLPWELLLVRDITKNVQPIVYSLDCCNPNCDYINLDLWFGLIQVVLPSYLYIMKYNLSVHIFVLIICPFYSFCLFL